MTQATRIEIRQNAGAGERFAPTAFDAQIGKEVPIEVEGQRKGDGRLVGAKVIDDGLAVLLTYELDNPEVVDFLRAHLLTSASLSFRVVPTEPRTAAATAAVVRRGQETKAAALREAGWLVIPPEQIEEAVAALDAIDPDDPEEAHNTADGILQRLAGAEVAKAYRRLADDRCDWWASA